VSATGSYLHKTLLAASAQGLRNLMKISSLASLEGHYRKYPRMDDELLEQYHEGIIATTGCPSGAVQTRLRLGQYDEALKVAGKYQDIFGKENYFLELMDHGIPIETAVRSELLRIAKHLGIPLLATNDSHYVTEDQAAAHDALLCIGTNSQVDDPTRFRFSGASYYLRTADEMRALNSSDEWAEACRNTLLIAERVESYKEVFAHRDLAAKFPVPDGETEMTWLRKEAQRGAARRYGAEVPYQITERIEFELGVIEQMGFPGYFWSSPTSASTRGTTRSRSAPVEGRPPAAWSPTSPGSPSSTRSSTACCSSGSSTPSASACPTSTWTSTSVAAAT